MWRYGLLAMCGAWVIAASACAPRATEGGFDSDNPSAKLYAIRNAGLNRDRDAVPELVESLSHDDPAVRMMAISALDRITGTRLGYNPFASSHERDAAVKRWEQAARTGDFGDFGDDKPADEPTEQPTEQPADQPADQPAAGVETSEISETSETSEADEASEPEASEPEPSEPETRG